MERTDIPGYVYSGDVNIADYGGKWIGIARNTCGEVIEVIGASDLEDGDELGALISTGSIYVRGQFEREPLHAVYFYQLSLLGDGEQHWIGSGDEDFDQDADPELDYTSFEIHATDAAAFPALADNVGKHFNLAETDQGFVNTWIDE